MAYNFTKQKLYSIVVQYWLERKLKSHFEHIYTCDDRLESAKIEVLSTDMYIPTLDDPIDSREFTDALKVCKKAGYDISLPIFSKIVLSFLPLIFLIFNSIFYVSY